mgnify:CR=1 FL=1
MVAQTVDPGLQAFPGAPVRETEELIGVADKQVETVETIGLGCNPPEIGPRVLPAAEVIADQHPPRWGSDFQGSRITVVRKGRHPPSPGDPKPRPPIPQIPARKQIRRVIPEVGRRRQSFIELVPVRREDEREIRMHFPGEQYQAHDPASPCLTSARMRPIVSPAEAWMTTSAILSAGVGLRLTITSEAPACLA